MKKTQQARMLKLSIQKKLKEREDCEINTDDVEDPDTPLIKKKKNNSIVDVDNIEYIKNKVDELYNMKVNKQPKKITTEEPTKKVSIPKQQPIKPIIINLSQCEKKY